MDDIRIYALTDPATGLVGYIGRSASPQIRYRDHRGEPGGHGEPSTDGALKHQWLRTLRASGREPQLVILDTARDLAHAKQLELQWIAHFRLRGEATGNGHDRNRNLRPRIVVHAPSTLKGDTLKRARRAAGMSLSVLAFALGVSESAVCRWETGSRTISRGVESELMGLLPALRGRAPRTRKKRGKA